eukprot:s4710_g6.t1
MAERSERSASNRMVIGTTAVLQIFEGLVQYRLWVALLCLAGTCLSPQLEVKLLPEQSGVELLQPDGFEVLTRASVLAHLRATGGTGAPVLRREGADGQSSTESRTERRAPQSGVSAAMRRTCREGSDTEWYMEGGRRWEEQLAESFAGRERYGVVDGGRDTEWWTEVDGGGRRWEGRKPCK